MEMMRIHADEDGLVIEHAAKFFRPKPSFSWDELFKAEDAVAFVQAALTRAEPAPAPSGKSAALLGSQEVWAAGVTYWRSRAARMAESQDAAGGSFYDRVYVAERPELFFKATPHRVVAPGAEVRIRGDSRWNVPEPELTLAVNSSGRIFGYTIGNDMSSRDIEGENPLYLPQAKVYLGCAALGPCLVLTPRLPDADTKIELEIRRGGMVQFAGATTVGQIKRPLTSLAEWLFRDNAFPHGCYLMTGTGIVPPDDFTLQRGDEIRITLAPVGTLVNRVG